MRLVSNEHKSAVLSDRGRFTGVINGGKKVTSVSNLHNSKLLECCIDLISLELVADAIKLKDPDFQMKSDLNCLSYFFMIEIFFY